MVDKNTVVVEMWVDDLTLGAAVTNNQGWFIETKTM